MRPGSDVHADVSIGVQRSAHRRAGLGYRLYASLAMNTRRHLFEHGRDRNLLLVGDCFVNTAPVGICR